MKHITEKDLILSLIKDDLINTKLVSGLGDIGLNAENYLLHLSDTIFKLMGFESNEETEQLLAHYLQLARRAKLVDTSHSHREMDNLALEIYLALRESEERLR